MINETHSELVKYEPQSNQPAAAALSVAEVKTRLDLIRDVMANAMKTGQDYGKVPGCGDKPGLFQAGAQKLSMMFQLNPEVRQETTNDYQNFHRGYRLIVRVANGNKFAEGVGECSTLETKYRYRNSGLKCPKCGKETILKSKNQGEGWFCWAKKGGCAATFSPDSLDMANQKQGKVEHENPPDFWNTARKMAFKRAFVHAVINATNTSELWSQDLEDLRDNGVMGEPEPQQERESYQESAREQRRAPEPARAQAAPSGAAGDTREIVNFVDYNIRKSKPDAAKPWTAYFCKFERNGGEALEAATFSETIAAAFDTLKGNAVALVHRPGRKPGTTEIVSVEPATEKQTDDVPF